uniref:Uncharacterized protein n=1 Tax=Physcomitrium patens TaxID=3218 RepID=A0A2K1IB19_PHYPA|nr:hypothetical protein PHYPA_031040 [Physcomitrium patens]
MAHLYIGNGDQNSQPYTLRILDRFSRSADKIATSYETTSRRSKRSLIDDTVMYIVKYPRRHGFLRLCTRHTTELHH